MSRYIPLICLALAHTLVDTCAQLIEPLWPGIRQDYGLAGMGALSLAFVIQSLPTSLSQAVFGYIRDLRSTPWLMWAGPLLGAVCMSSLGLYSSPIFLGMLLVLGGIGIGAFHPEAAVAAGRALPEHRTRAISVFMLGGALGLGLGPIISGAIARTWGVAGLVGLMPVLIILIGVFWWTGRLGSLSPKTKTDAPRLSISEAFEGRGKLALAIFLICSLRLVPNMAVAKVLSFMLVGWGYDEFETGLVQSLFLAAASVGMFLMAFRFRAGLEKSFMIWCPVAGIPMLVIMGWPSCPSWLFMTMLIATGLTLWGTIPAMVSYAQQQFPKGAGMASAITMGLAWGLGGIIQAPITAHFSETSHPQQAFFAFIPCLMISAIGAKMLPPSREPKTD